MFDCVPVNSMLRLQDHNMTAKEAYQYFVLRAQDIAISTNMTPVNWYVSSQCFIYRLL